DEAAPFVLAGPPGRQARIDGGGAYGQPPRGEEGDVSAVDVVPVERKLHPVHDADEVTWRPHLVLVQPQEGDDAEDLTAPRRAALRDRDSLPVDRRIPEDGAVDGL